MKSRSNLWFAVGVVAVGATVIAAYLLLLGREEPIAAPVPVVAPRPPAPEQLVTATLSRAVGPVELKRPEGEWQQATLGAFVAAGMDVRTRPGGSAALSYGDAIDVELGAESAARIERLDAEVARVVVREGLVTADVRPESGRTLQIAAENSDAVTETRDGRVHVLTDGQGRVQTAVTRGQATLTAQGESVELPAGFQTAVEPGKPPPQPTAIPSSLLLKVKWPPGGSTPKRRQLVTGTTTPGSRVKVGASMGMADANGRFRMIVELTEGQNQIPARVVDVVGRSEVAQSPAIELDTSAPSHAVETDPGMWKRRDR